MLPEADALCNVAYTSGNSRHKREKKRVMEPKCVYRYAPSLAKKEKEKREEKSQNRKKSIPSSPSAVLQQQTMKTAGYTKQDAIKLGWEQQQQEQVYTQGPSRGDRRKSDAP